jgi:hypothetical protein
MLDTLTYPRYPVKQGVLLCSVAAADAVRWVARCHPARVKGVTYGRLHDQRDQALIGVPSVLASDRGCSQLSPNPARWLY